MKYTVQLTALTTAILIAGVTMADARRVEGAERAVFETLDIDGNGEVTQAEMATVRKARFDEMDTDNNGALTKAELAVRSEKRAERAIKHLDANGDGQLTFAEMESRSRRDRLFDRADSDNSGTVSKAEFEAVAKKMRGRFKARNERGTDG